MKKIMVLFVLLALFLSACGGGAPATDDPSNTGGGSPTDTSIAFNIFPPGFFTNYDVATTLSGKNDSLGITYTGDTSDKTQAQAIFLAEEAIPVVGRISFTGSNGSFGSATVTSYFNTDENDRRLLGVEADTSTASATTRAIPLMANIGNSGVFGTYIDNVGYETSAVWLLEDGFDGRARLVLINVTRDTAGDIDNTMKTTYLIEPNGARLSVEYEMANPNAGILITLRGTY